MKQLCGCFDLNTSEYSDSSVGVYTFSDKGVSVYVCGRVQTENGVNNGDTLVNLYKSYGT